MRDKVTRQCPQTTTIEEKGEPKRIRTEAPLLTSLTARPNRLTLKEHAVIALEIEDGERADVKRRGGGGGEVYGRGTSVTTAWLDQYVTSSLKYDSASPRLISPTVTDMDQLVSDWLPSGERWSMS